MPLKRKSWKRRPKKSSWRKRKGGLKALIKKEIGKQCEMKQRYVVHSEDSVNTLNPNNVYELAGMVQGTGAYQRIGNEIIVRGVHSKGFLHNNSAKTVYVRHMIGFLTVEDSAGSTCPIFRETSGEAVGPSTLAAPYHTIYYPLYKRFFKTIYDKVYRLEGIDATTGGNKNTHFFNVFKKLNKKLRFSANTSSTLTKPRMIECFFCATADADDGTGYVVELNQIATLYWNDP